MYRSIKTLKSNPLVNQIAKQMQKHFSVIPDLKFNSATITDEVVDNKGNASSIKKNIMNIHIEESKFKAVENLPFPIYISTRKINKDYMPLHKTNILISLIGAYLSYGGSLFQPTLLLSGFLIYKYFLFRHRINTYVRYIALHPTDGETVKIETNFMESYFLIKDIKIQEHVDIDGRGYYILSTKFSNRFFVEKSMDILNTKLFEELFSGSFDGFHLNNLI